MTYTQLAVLAVGLVIVWDLWIVGTRLLTRRVFWMAYPIILLFQLITNGLLTGTRIVRYSGAAIVGSSTPDDAAPAFLGDGRIAFAPVEDLMFGFALVVLTLTLWVAWGRRGVEREPMAGPPLSVLVPILAKVGGRASQENPRRALRASRHAAPATRSRRPVPTVARWSKTS